MNKTDARKIAETITNEQLQAMFDNAKNGVKDWTEVSNVNKGITKGAGWNILAKNFDTDYTHHILAKTNMVREFGEYLPAELKLNKIKYKNPKPIKLPVHQDPIFN